MPRRIRKSAGALPKKPLVKRHCLGVCSRVSLKEPIISFRRENSKPIEKVSQLTAQNFYARWAGNRSTEHQHPVHPDTFDEWVEFAEAYAQQTKQFAAQLESNIKFLNERIEREQGLLRRAAELLATINVEFILPADLRKGVNRWLDDSGVGHFSKESLKAAVDDDENTEVEK